MTMEKDVVLSIEETIREMSLVMDPVIRATCLIEMRTDRTIMTSRNVTIVNKKAISPETVPSLQTKTTIETSEAAMATEVETGAVAICILEDEVVMVVEMAVVAPCTLILIMFEINEWINE